MTVPQIRSMTGLTDAEVADRVARGQTNFTKAKASRSMKDIVRSNVFTAFNLVIGVLWVIMLATAPIQDSLFGMVIIVNTAIGIFQEYRAARTLERLTLVGAAKPTVRRNGVEVSVASAEIVRHDLIVLRAGDQVAVDGAILESAGLEIDESLLTGEADPVDKAVGDQALSGSFVVSGSGVMSADKVGAEAYAARLADEAKAFTRAKSELMESIMRFVKVMSYVLIPVGIMLFITQRKTADTIEEAISGTVAGVVTMIPEGLVLLTSVAMAVAVVRLGQKRTLVQEMPAVEILARVDVVCVDKTGTLTEPGMKVRDLRVLDESVPVQRIFGAIGVSEESPNPTLQAVAAQYPPPADIAVAGNIPFSSARKWSAAKLQGSAQESGWWLMGAPEILLKTDDGKFADALAISDEYAAKGSRVLVLAKADVPEGTDPTNDGALPAVSPAALVVIDQSLRSDAADTVQYFLDQGVTVKVISGDNATTVGAIAAEAGIEAGEAPVDARTLPEDIEELADILERNNVFGRVTPVQKRAMVKALQSRGHVVAMTGDGVNDVLALKDADLGISMGSGAGATRAVAQIVLLDNQFSVMPSVVAEGRRVLGNIERVSDLFLNKSFYAVTLALMTTFFSVQFPFLPRHLSVVTVLTIGTPAFFLALMPNSERFQPGFFKRVLSFAVPAGIICAVAAMTSYRLVLLKFQGEVDAGTLPATEAVAQARVSATITLFIAAWVVLYLVARPMNPLRIAIVAAMAGGFVLVMLIPWLSEFFALNVHPDADLIIALGAGAAAAGALILLRLVRAGLGFNKKKEPAAAASAA